ncbi:BAR domain-containing protein [Roseateles koreensis]|uniref:Uncharacterized protein n=1 Tax=Roseateles koreensis TaxID=2987526 RepID=A0ABT5KSN2_9BURK|nr:hypothetical protein [Roseateles koreensis]MDC8785425.1 hypothetical protein [Roseateles koreensis]
MPVTPAVPLPELEAALDAIVQERYNQAESDAEVDALALAAEDHDYLKVRIQCLEAMLSAANNELAWIGPNASYTPAQALRRIKALCLRYPDLFNALFTVAATHPTVPREMLAMAIKQFRRDTESLSNDDVVGLLTGLVNGSNQAFDAILRTRKGADRKASALPWGKDTD